MLLASIICMAALFLRKRLLAWTGFVLTASAFMSDNGARSASSQSPLSMLFMSVAALLSSYLPLLMNPPDKR
ncbi:fungal protein [Schizosaccharomyces japonicus yFS275]|uniref:Fungal protein n=1 Tax=Schizosaccharomyces japonicus (strain yFS275 / FY16936) TaxID=402676 RepID=T0RSZ8_SCHJY|nr:fungal protein [Schizosaccharomyces japonicus yFS275]EQC53070.1 fungal protein [Schizosaccharomyces japonicus yFS275]